MKLPIALMVIILALGFTQTACDVPSEPTPAHVSIATSQSKLLVGVDANYPSFVAIDPNNVGFVGFDVDVMKAIAAKADLDIEFVNVGLNQLAPMIGRCQLQVGISAIAITEQLKQQMILSDPYYATGQVVVVKKGNIKIIDRNSLPGMSVGTQARTLSEDEVKKIAGTKLIPYESYNLAFQGLIPGYIDAVVTDRPRALSFAQVKSNNLKIVGEEFGSVNLGVAICRTRTDLAAKINMGIAAAKSDGTVSRLAKKWLTNPR